MSTVIESREAFDTMLDEALAEVEKRYDGPGLAPDFWLPILRQLRAMKMWTANDRSPSDAERTSIDVGPFAVRELRYEDPLHDKLVFLYEYFTEAA